jgi:dihydroorotase-like cyclic amidohydrolase
MPELLEYIVTLTHPDGAVVTELEIPVLQEHADASGSAGSRLCFTDEDALSETFRTTRQGETALRLGLSGLEHDACHHANQRAIAAARALQE